MGSVSRFVTELLDALGTSSLSTLVRPLEFSAALFASERLPTPSRSLRPMASGRRSRSKGFFRRAVAAPESRVFPLPDCARLALRARKPARFPPQSLVAVRTERRGG